MTEPSILYLSEAIVPVTRSVILEPQVPELVEGCGDRIHKQIKNVQVKSLGVFTFGAKIIYIKQ